MPFISQNPATEAVIAEYPAVDVQAALAMADAVYQAWLQWRRTSYATRAQCLRRAAELLRARKSELARLMAAEMGKPLAEGEGEAEKSAWVCDYYAEEGAAFLRDQAVATDAAKSYVHFEPLGPVLAIMPWNFPLWQTFRFAAPALAAGNAFLLKHAPNVTGCALAIEKLLQEAGLPDNVCRALIAENDTVAAVIGHRAIRAVTLTGSVRAGRTVAAVAGRHLKKTVLELGGSDPYLILEDADVAEAAKICVASRMINGGQSCIAAKRLIALKPVAAEFKEAVVALMKQKTYGDPLAGRFDIGPMARADLRDELHRQVTVSAAAGATVALGGQVPDRTGGFYPPTVLLDPPLDSPAFCQELFGPAAAILVADDEDHAVRLANDSVYGLGAAVFTADPERGERLARRGLQAGACFVNDFVRSDPRLPFGGVKDSGYGRELSIFGIREFLNVKTVYVR